jgi:predicted RNA binding protein YcfA (HicA-like mRNA interferase family)
MKGRDLIKQLERMGGTWLGSHRQFKHSTKRGNVTVAGKPHVDVPAGTLNAILKQTCLI